MVIPYQWDALNDSIPEAEPSHAIEISALPQASRQAFYGMVFQVARRGEMAGSDLLVTVPEARSRA